MKKEESTKFEQFPINLKNKSSSQPIGILKIQNEQVWLSFLKITPYYKPDNAILPYQIVKEKYPHLVSYCCYEVAERLLYDKFKFVALIQNTENQQQACIFDFNGKECLVKWLPSERFSWIPVAQADPLNLIDFLDTLEIYKVY